jgi:hypothetical protein
LLKKIAAYVMEPAEEAAECAIGAEVMEQKSAKLAAVTVTAELIKV